MLPSTGRGFKIQEADELHEEDVVAEVRKEEEDDDDVDTLKNVIDRLQDYQGMSRSVTTVDVHRTTENESLVGLDDLSDMGMTTSSKRGKKKKKKRAAGLEGEEES